MMRKRRASGNFAVTISVVLALFAVLVYMGVTKGSNVIPANKTKQYDAVMALDFNADYPVGPDAVLEKYCETDMFLSGNTNDGFTNSELEIVVEKQRMLLHPDLLENNPFETHVKGYADKIDYLKQYGMRLTQFSMETPRFSEDAKTCSIGVKQYWTGNLSINMVYNIKKEDSAEKWKIIGWYINEQKGD